jgi:two-component system OmpR family sensor kinase
VRTEPRPRPAAGGGLRARLSDRLAGTTLLVRLVATTIALLAVVCLVIGTLSSLLLREYLVDQRDAQVEALAKRSAAFYTRAERQPNHDDDDIVEDFLNAPGQTAGLLSARIVNGSVRQAGTLDDDGDTDMEHHTRELAAIRAIPTDGDTHTRELGDLGTYRVLADTRDDGVVLVTGLSLDDADGIVGRLVRIELGVALAGLLLAGAASAVMVRLNLRPLNRVAGTARRVSRVRMDRGEVTLADRVPPGDTDPRTEVGQMGAALNTMIEHVAAALDARQASETQLRQFLADASHELRTPLAAIRGYAELAGRSSEPVPPDVEHALRRVSSQAERMTSLVEDMLLLARIDAGRPLAQEPVDLSQLVVDAVSDAHATAPDHRWTLSLPDEAVTMTGDATRLTQVLTNLLANARVHTPPGTTVQAELAFDADSRAGPGILMIVRDDGPGIPEELLPRVFSRFARGDSSRSRAAGSTGLGLAIAHAVVTAHRGMIGVTSRPGRTEFIVRLPADPVPSGAGPNNTGANDAGPHNTGPGDTGPAGPGGNGSVPPNAGRPGRPGPDASGPGRSVRPGSQLSGG